jgi:hypothetical protein
LDFWRDIQRDAQKAPVHILFRETVNPFDKSAERDALKKLRKSINQVTIFVSFNGLTHLHGILYT